MGLLSARIEDPPFLEVVRRVLDGGATLYADPRNRAFARLGPDWPPPGRGLPIGQHTSQVFVAWLYLDALDHHIKRVLKVPGYLRYVDDMVVLDQDKTRLADIRAAVRERLAVDRLRLHPHKAQVTRTADGLNLLGYVLFPDRRRLRNDNGHRFARKLRTMARAYRAGRLEWAKVAASVQSWIGHAKHADTEGLRRAIFSRASFIRGSCQATAIV